jgi:hypothetical protein
MTISDKKVIVNEEKRTVATILVDEFGEKYVGIAKCHPDDVFDAEIGTVVSLKKAKIKSHKTGISEAKKELKRLKKFETELNSYISDHSKAAEKIKAGLDSYLKEKLS